MCSDITTQLPVSTNLVQHHATITRAHREAKNSHRGVILWFTGLSGAGKSTLAHAVEEHLHQLGCKTFVLDGDNVRHGLCGDLSFSDQDRIENIRRIGEVAKIFMEAGIIVLTAFISPFRNDRDRVQQIIVEMIKRGVCALQPDVTFELGSKKYCQGNGIEL